MTPVNEPLQHILTLERQLAAPREAVFHAWTDAKAFAQWFGPHDVAVPLCELDARPGDRIRFCHQLPDGLSVYLQGQYGDVVPPERLVFTIAFTDENWQPAPHPGYPELPVDAAMVITVTLAETAEGTWMTVAQHATAMTIDLKQFWELTRLGWNETLVRLTDYLNASTQETSVNEAIATRDGAEIVLTRRFDHPPADVFAAWTKPEVLAQWWGPNGFTLTIAHFDMRPGGIWQYMMHGPDGVDYPNVVQYREIDPPRRIVYSHGEEVGGPGFEVTATFEPEGQGTRLTMHMVFPSAEAAREVVEQYGALEGGKQTLGRLAAYLGEA